MRSPFAAVLLLLATSALAQPRISSISPDEVNVNSGEHTVTITGSGFAPEYYANRATFRGPAGEYSIAPNGGSSSTLYVWVPSQVVYTVGTYEVTIHNGTAESAPAQFHVRPAAGPTLFLPSRVSTEATGPDGAVVTYSAYATAADGSAATITCAPASGEQFQVDLTSVRCTGVDDSGGRTDGLFWVHVTDYTPPIIGVPEEVLARATTATGAIVTWEAMAIDTVDTDVPVQCYPASGTHFPVGTTEVRCQAVDDHHNFAYASFPVTVVDDARPILHLPDDIEVPAEDAQGSAVHWTATATADDGSTIPAYCAPETGSLFPIGRTSVSCSASDVDGHTSTGTFWVTVTPVSASGTTLTLPDDITVEAEDDSGAVVTFTATAKDADGNDVAVSCMPPSGSRFPVGTTTVTCTANDATGTFSVTVNPPPPPPDTTAPVIRRITASPNVLWPVDRKFHEVTIAVDASDDLDPDPSARITAVAVNEPGGNDVRVTGALTLELRATRDANSGEDRIYTITVEVTDDAGNASTGAVEVRVPHDNSGNDPLLSKQPPTLRKGKDRNRGTGGG